ncbi:hypothetical protein E8E13_001031 [Curvularia kusanoi]|uniref:Uncharacterized protein n=1 Tax=Curvularia kusanoi TaxID=90978 RepID=A0A9P4T6H7_CURKU|nr:hypothetical protein E8E13_001031 [Curvularia kusanoi]
MDNTKENIKLYTLESNGAAPLYKMNTALSDALRSGIQHSNPIDPLGTWNVPKDLNSGLAGLCLFRGQCSWDAFKTLALCSSGEDVTREITLEDNRITLPALKGLLRSDQEPPSFQSGLHGYTRKNGSATATFPATSISDGTNLPNLAEVYYLFYDPCVDSAGVDKSNMTHWRAYKGRFQFCIQTLKAISDSASKDGLTKDGTTMTLINSAANLDWNQATRGNYSAFCTKVDGEEEDFCVSEALMQSLASHMSSIFNTTAIFNDSDLRDIQYSSEWGPLLTGPIYRNCADDMIPRIAFFRDMLEGITYSLTNKFRNNENDIEQVYGTFTHVHTVVLVDFRWLILPIALWSMIVIFFFSTIVTTRNTPMWKSSPLPLLSLTSSDITPASEERIRKEAKKTWMELRWKQIGWQMLHTTEERGVKREEPQGRGELVMDL